MFSDIIRYIKDHSISIGVWTVVAILVVLIAFSDDASYYLLHYPFYYLFGDSFYCTLYLKIFKMLLVIVLFLAIGVSIAPDLLAKESKLARRLLDGFIILFFVGMVIMVFWDEVRDLRMVSSNRSEKYETALSHNIKLYHSGGRGGGNWYYYLYHQPLSKRERARGNVVDLIELDIYQYRDILRLNEKYKSEGYDPDSIVLKANYLPTSNLVLNYTVEMYGSN